MMKATAPTPGLAHSRDRFWGGLQPRAVARGDLAAGRRADARSGGHGRDGGRLRLGAIAAPPGSLGRSAGSDRVLDLLHENGIAVDLATATASPPPWLVTRAPGDPAGRRARHAAGDRQPADLVPEFAGVPRAFARAGPGTRDPLRRSSGGRDVARLERIGQPQRQLFLRGQPAALPGLAARRGTATLETLNDAVGHRLLEPALLVVRRDRSAGRDHRLSATRGNCWIGDGSAPTPCSTSIWPRSGCSGEITPIDPGDHQFPGRHRAGRDRARVTAITRRGRRTRTSSRTTTT